jgi:hypothetical protein
MSELLSYWTLPITCYIQNTKEQNFRRQNLFPSEGKGSEAPTLLGPLERTEEFRESFVILNF